MHKITHNRKLCPIEKASNLKIRKFWLNFLLNSKKYGFCEIVLRIK